MHDSRIHIENAILPVETQYSMKLAVIIVSYNTVDLLRDSLSSVYHSAQVSGMAKDDLRVVVVDNASTDGCPEMVAAEFPQVQLIALQENLGFTRANNVALATLGFSMQADSAQASVATPDFVLLLNPDAVLVENALGQLTSFLARTPNAGACGAHLQYGDGVFQHGAFMFPSPAQVALDLLPVEKLPGGYRLYDSKLNGRYSARQWSGVEPFEVDFVLGATLMMRGETLLQIGGLDEGYFMYCEEMDWCLRAQQACWHVYALPAAHIVHHEGQSSRQTPWPAFTNLWRSRMRFYRKHRRRYFPGHLMLVRTILRMTLGYRARAAWRAFTHGDVTGEAVATELSAYRTLASL